MMVSLVGLVLAALIVAGCHRFDLPLPATPRLIGALLVVAMTLGFLFADLGMARWESV